MLIDNCIPHWIVPWTSFCRVPWELCHRCVEQPPEGCFLWNLCHFLEMCSSPSCLCVLLFQVLCNGPGTCVPLCVAGLLLGILGMKKVLIVYVESICRVQTLSLTGKILYPMSDYFFVQWASLRDKYPKSIFLGRIVWKHWLHIYTNVTSNMLKCLL